MLSEYAPSCEGPISVAVTLSGHTEILFGIPQHGSPQLESAEGGSSLLQKLKFNLCLIIKTPNNSFHVWAEPLNYRGGSKHFYTGWRLLMWKFPGPSSGGLINDVKDGERASVLWHWLKVFLFPSRLQNNLWVVSLFFLKKTTWHKQIPHRLSCVSVLMHRTFFQKHTIGTGVTLQQPRVRSVGLLEGVNDAPRTAPTVFSWASATRHALAKHVQRDHYANCSPL